MSLDAASRSTRIRPRYLAALEDDAGVDAFPGSVYARFFLKEYARYLGVDDAPLVDALEERTAPEPSPLRVVGELEPPRRWVARLVRIAAVVALLGLVGYTVVQSGGRSDPGAETRSDGLTQAPADVPPSDASNGRPTSGVPIRTVVDVVAPVHALILVDGERVVNRVLQPHRFVFEVRRKGTTDPRIELTIADGSAVRLTVNGRPVPTDGRAPFRATFVASSGRAVRL